MEVLRKDCIPIDIFLSLFEFYHSINSNDVKNFIFPCKSIGIDLNEKKNNKMNHTANICYDKIDQMKKVIFYGLLKIPPQNSQIQIEALFFPYECIIP